MKTLDFFYQETQIHFLVNPLEKNVMVNATEMAKPFNKEVRSFLRLDGTKKFIETLLKNENIRTDVHGYNVEESNFIDADVPRYLTEKDIVQTNNKAGTIMHKKLALKFAAWLDVEFELWIIDKIDEVLFGNYQKHWEAHAQQEVARVAMADIKTEILHNPTPESVAAYFNYEQEYKNLSKAKTKAIKNQLNLFSND